MKCSQVETVGDSCEKTTHKCENNLLLKKNKNKNQKISSKTDNWQLLCISKLMYPHSIISTENISKVVTVRHVAITTTYTQFIELEWKYFHSDSLCIHEC